MTTSEPSLAQEMNEVGKKKGITVVDAPVSGGDIGAKNAALSIMIGCDSKETVEELNPLFQCMGKNIKYMGLSGCGQHTKMVNQILISTMMVFII